MCRTCALGRLFLFSLNHMGSEVSIIDLLHLGSTMSLRHASRMGNTLSLIGLSRFGSTVSVLGLRLRAGRLRAGFDSVPSLAVVASIATGAADGVSTVTLSTAISGEICSIASLGTS